MSGQTRFQGWTKKTLYHWCNHSTQGARSGWKDIPVCREARRESGYELKYIMNTHWLDPGCESRRKLYLRKYYQRKEHSRSCQSFILNIEVAKVDTALFQKGRLGSFPTPGTLPPPLSFAQTRRWVELLVFSPPLWICMNAPCPAPEASVSMTSSRSHYRK